MVPFGALTKVILDYGIDGRLGDIHLSGEAFDGHAATSDINSFNHLPVTPNPS